MGAIERFEVPSDSLNERVAQADRPGWDFDIPGEALKLGSKLWSDEQKQKGIKLGMMFLTSAEEEDALSEAARSGKLASAGIIQVRRSLAKVGVFGAEPGAEGWRNIAHADKIKVWEELGPKGRGMAMAAHARANAPSQEALAVAADSFRIGV